nr:IS66 family transposase [Methylobacter luteus]
MNPLAELAHLNLDPDAKRQVTAVVQVQQDAEILRAKEAELQAKDTEIQAKDLKIQALTLELAHIKRIRYGVKSEALAPLQRDVFEETWNTDLSALEAEIEQLADNQPCTTVVKPQRPRAGRQPLPDHLPRIEHRHEPDSCTCGQCGQDLVKIGEDISEQLDVEPARFFVHRHIRPQYACRQCETVAAAPIPPAVIDGGLAAVGLLAWVLIGKYVDHLPLYRLEQIAAREQVSLSRSTLADLAPAAGQYPACRETPVAQLDPGSGKTRKAYLWAYRSNDLQPGPRIIVFDYQPGRSGAHARQFLGAWRGHLLVDDYGGYKALFAGGDQAACIELGCWSHVRRKFFDLHQANGSPMALAALERIGTLYAIEATGRDLDCEARKQLRAAQSRPALEALHDWLVKTRVQTADGGASAKAIDYALKRWPALVRYAETGHLPIDNNVVENDIRPIAWARRNGCSSVPRAGRRAAGIQTLLGTARLNGLDPAAWLKDTLAKLPVWPNSRIDELLPLAPDFIETLKQK